jgi:hypothetical protein
MVASLFLLYGPDVRVHNDRYMGSHASINMLYCAFTIELQYLMLCQKE